MLIGHELIHFVLSLIAGGILAYYFRNKWLIIYSILIGMLVDVDHLFDYFLYKKSFSINLTEFFSGTYFDATNKVILPFHGFEYVIILAALGFVFLKLKNKKIAMTGIFFTLSLSLFFHLTYDTIYYRPKWPTYFISYRIYHHFNHNYFWLKENLNRK